MALTIHITLPKGWKNHAAAVNEGLKSGLHKATIFVTNQAIANAPRRTGNLKRSIHMEVSAIGAFTGKIIQDTKVAKYGPFVEYGTGIHGPKGQPITIQPVNKKALFWKGAAHPVRKVVSPGMKARPYMRPALKDNVDKIEAIINEEIMKKFREAGGG